MSKTTNLPFKTKNSLPAEARSQIVDQINERLVELIDLQLQTKQAHWNVKGPNFIGLHELFDELAEAVEDYADMIAERAVQLGGIATGTVQAIAAGSKLEDYPTRPITWSEHVLFLSTSIAKVGESVRGAIDWSDDLGDADTADIFTEISRGLDVWLWKVESHTTE